MTKTEAIRAAQAEFAEKRSRAQRELDARIDEASRIDPEIGRLRAENAHLAVDALRRMTALTDMDARRAVAEDMKKRGLANNAEIRRRLTAAGLGADYLEMRSECPLCRDTGLVGEAPSRFCECFERRLRLLQFEDGSMASTLDQCFEKFDETRIPEDGSQRRLLNMARRACEDYADSFPKTRFANLLLSGSGGLGKTFLLNCVFERVISRGFSAARITAFRMLEAMRRQCFGAADGEVGFDQLLEAPLLLIDDLGSEPMMKNITVEYLFTLLNERMAAGRHTVIATNLSPVQLKERYGERVASRLLDRSKGLLIQLEGKDLRLL